MSEAVKQALREHHAAVVSEAVAALDSDDFAGIRLELREGLKRYLEDRIATGSFLRAVLSNDLVDAVGRAHPLVDMVTMRLLRSLLFGYFPQKAWGSEEKVAAWIAAGEETPL